MNKSIKQDIFLDAIARAKEELEAAPPTEVTSPLQAGETETPSIIVPIDDIIANALSEVPPEALAIPPGDPLSGYLECLKSLCNTTGGTYIDDNPDKRAGCYFRTNTEAAGYALLAWSCLPTGFLKSILSVVSKEA